MADVHIFAIDLAKRSFQVCATDPGVAVLFNRTTSRAKLEQLLGTQQTCIVATEVCVLSRFWGRCAQSHGHDVTLIPPIYVKRQKSDAATQQRLPKQLCARKFISWQSADHQAKAESVRTHQCFVLQRTQLNNALCRHLADFGVVIPQGQAYLNAVTVTLADASDAVSTRLTDIARLFLE